MVDTFEFTILDVYSKRDAHEKARQYVRELGLRDDYGCEIVCDHIQRVWRIKIWGTRVIKSRKWSKSIRIARRMVKYVN